MACLVSTAIVHAGQRLQLTMRQLDNFEAKVEIGDGCWLWIGSVDRHGYGKFNIKPYQVSAHRIAYQLHVGPIPDGHDIDHLCRIRRCVNPAHLDTVTRRENIMRSPIALSAVNAVKTACIKGHPFDQANTYIDPAGYRHCRACSRAANRRWIAGEATPRPAGGARAGYRRAQYHARAAQA